MSAGLRRAVRVILPKLRRGEPLDREITDRISTILKNAEEKARGRVFVPSQDALAALIEALNQFKRHDSPHFAGCPADRTGGPCSRPCALARAALHPALVTIAVSTVEALKDEVRALYAERARQTTRLKRCQENHRDTLRKAHAETGFVMRGPGRPRKTLAEHKGTPALTPP